MHRQFLDLTKKVGSKSLFQNMLLLRHIADRRFLLCIFNGLGIIECAMKKARAIALL